MSKKQLLYIGLLIGTCVINHVRAMVFDNRFLPLLQQPHLSIDGTRSQFSMEGMMATASKAFNEHQNDVPLPEIYGKFNQVDLANSIVALCKPNPLPSEYQGLVAVIPWDVTGKRQMQGVRFFWHQNIVSWLATGFSWTFMSVNSRDEFFLNEEKIEGKPTRPVESILFDDIRRSMFATVGLHEGNVQQSGFGDIDWFVRLGNMWEYTARFRRIDAGLKVGALFATGVTQMIDYPQSIPFGGNGHYGMYGAVDSMFELRENWKTGFVLRVSKRFPNTKIRRMPAGKEPVIYGAVVGQAEVNPGVTVTFDPYFLLEGVRKGLALGLNYTLIWHMEDKWCDRRECKVPAVCLGEVEGSSAWASEYFTVNVLYDFGKVKIKREFNPVLTFRWDIPSSLFIASRSSRTNCVSIGVEFVY